MTHQLAEKRKSFLTTNTHKLAVSIIFASGSWMSSDPTLAAESYEFFEQTNANPEPALDNSSNEQVDTIIASISNAEQVQVQDALPLSPQFSPKETSIEKAPSITENTNDTTVITKVSSLDESATGQLIKSNISHSTQIGIPENSKHVAPPANSFSTRFSNSHTIEEVSIQNKTLNEKDTTIQLTKVNTPHPEHPNIADNSDFRVATTSLDRDGSSTDIFMDSDSGQQTDHVMHLNRQQEVLAYSLASQDLKDLLDDLDARELRKIANRMRRYIDSKLLKANNKNLSDVNLTKAIVSVARKRAYEAEVAASLGDTELAATRISEAHEVLLSIGDVAVLNGFLKAFRKAALKPNVKNIITLLVRALLTENITEREREKIGDLIENEFLDEALQELNRVADDVISLRPASLRERDSRVAAAGFGSDSEDRSRY